MVIGLISAAGERQPRGARPLTRLIDWIGLLHLLALLLGREVQDPGVAVAVMGEFVPALQDLLHQPLALVDDQAGHEEGRLDAVAVEQVEHAAGADLPAIGALRHQDRAVGIGRVAASSTSSRHRDRRSGKAGSPCWSEAFSRTRLSDEAVEADAALGDEKDDAGGDDEQGRDRRRRWGRRPSPPRRRSAPAGWSRLALIRKIVTGTLSSEVMKANSAPATSPGAISGSGHEPEGLEAVGAEHARRLLDGEVEARQARQRRAHDIGHGDDDMGHQQADEAAAQAGSVL